MTELEKIEWKENFKAWLKEDRERSRMVRGRLNINRQRLHQWSSLIRKEDGNLFMPSKERRDIIAKMMGDTI